MNGAGTAEPLLRVEHISKRFGITQALDDVSVSFGAGEVHALMGENGAGKSTLGKAIAGLVKQDSGEVMIGGRRLTPGSLEEAFAAGVRIVHQELAQCPNLTVAENLCLHDLPRTRIGTVDRREMTRRARNLLTRIEPGIDPRAPLGSLSPGHRQIVQIAAALEERSAAAVKAVLGASAAESGGRRRLHAEPTKVIVFDEPTSSLSIAETGRLLKIVRQLAAEGLCIIYVSHRMGEIFECCDRVTVLRDGKFIATTSIKALDEPALVEQMIGRRLEAPVPRGGAARATGGEGEAAALRSLAADGGAHRVDAGAAPLLAVRQIASPGKLSGITLAIRPGEVLGVGGLVGSGRSELLDAIFGLDRAATGQVQVAGQTIERASARSAMRAGIGYVPEDRRLQGLFFQLGVSENILAPVVSRLAWMGFRALRKERALTAKRMREFQVKAASASALPGSLSGGNQQKLLIARWMSEEARVLLLDEPTRGIDVGTKAEVYKMIRAAADRGAAVLLVSSEMPELLALSDRIAVLCGGRMTGELTGEHMTQANILRLATMDTARAAG